MRARRSRNCATKTYKKSELVYSKRERRAHVLLTTETSLCEGCRVISWPDKLQWSHQSIGRAWSWEGLRLSSAHELPRLCNGYAKSTELGTEAQPSPASPRLEILPGKAQKILAAARLDGSVAAMELLQEIHLSNLQSRKPK